MDLKVGRWTSEKSNNKKKKDFEKAKRKRTRQLADIGNRRDNWRQMTDSEVVAEHKPTNGPGDKEFVLQDILSYHFLFFRPHT